MANNLYICMFSGSLEIADISVNAKGNVSYI